MDERALHILNLMQTYIAEYAHQPVRIYPPELESTLETCLLLRAID